MNATRYVLALREGGSLPAIVEADDFGLYVVKFPGAGQGPLALVAELVAGEIGRALVAVTARSFIFQLATASRLLGDDRKQASLRYAPQQIRTGR